MTDILLGIAVFTGLIMTLALVVLGARTILMPRGVAHITVNRERVIDAETGGKLLDALEHGGIHLPTSCGGVGTCGLCRVALSDPEAALPIDRATLEPAAIESGERLACQLVVREDLEITIAPELLSAERWSCQVAATRFVAPLIKEILLDLPEGVSRSFRAGSYVQITAPPYALNFSDLVVDSPYEAAWRRMGIRQFEARSDDSVARAYSLANHPGETEALLLNIRLALPPGGRPEVPPGVVSSWLFGVGVGDKVEVSGPYGTFFATESQREMVMIGGGVGMAPLRAHVFDQLEHRESGRRLSVWYGARGRADLYYDDEMERLAREHENFSWHVALSDPAPEDRWEGETGFIHDVVYRCYLEDHPDPGACEYFLCGPPLMIEGVLNMLAKLGVAPEDIRYDDVGG